MLKQKMTSDKTRMITSAVAYLRFKGYHEIKALLAGFDNPQAVFRKASEAGYTPDLIAQKDFGIHLFEVVDAPGDFSPEWLERWSVYADYAERKQGKFYLIAYSEDADLVSEKIEGLEPAPLILKIRR